MVDCGEQAGPEGMPFDFCWKGMHKTNNFLFIFICNKIMMTWDVVVMPAKLYQTGLL